jgi:hypothetical protein
MANVLSLLDREMIKILEVKLSIEKEMSGLSNAAFATFRARNLAIARNILFQSASYFAFGRKIIAQ